ncbi:hypothetical protein C2E20_9098 [Micractinium conductrix]|uniref:Sulfotransferase domain-containing protein n=1 Tax=Micractinium conductrix TaxID=554055 RepID=A0A2P6UZF5_9CHLO|nr:hypothetical protein C2E20_9098 [Micractinium conductrix]|eukprot:PSC67215.1 hypothetical protein C2E20_9098 [Micractinium conductrix]
MDASAFIDDLHNAVHIYCANGIDTLDGSLREQRCAALTPEQAAAALHGTSQLYLAIKEEVDTQLQKFEAYALETCLHVPAGLLVEQPSSTGANEAVDEAAVDAELAALRRQIAAAKHQGRKMAGEVQQYDAALATYRSSLGCLAGVPGALQGKENSLADDSRALAAAGLALQESCAELEGLRALRNSGGASGAGAPRDELAAEKEILRRQAAVRSAPADHLRRLQERLASGHTKQFAAIGAFTAALLVSLAFSSRSFMGGSLDSLSAAMGVSSGASRSRRMGDVAEVRLRQYERRQGLEVEGSSGGGGAEDNLRADDSTAYEQQQQQQQQQQRRWREEDKDEPGPAGEVLEVQLQQQEDAEGEEQPDLGEGAAEAALLDEEDQRQQREEEEEEAAEAAAEEDAADEGDAEEEDEGQQHAEDAAEEEERQQQEDEEAAGLEGAQQQQEQEHWEKHQGGDANQRQRQRGGKGSSAKGSSAKGGSKADREEEPQIAFLELPHLAERSPYLQAVAQCHNITCLSQAARQRRDPGQFLFPHFFVVGWQKAATTSLFFHLRTHPQLVAAWEKEPEFFSDDCGYDPFDCPLGAQLRYMYKVLRLGEALAADLRVAGAEASTHYGRNGHKLARSMRELFPWLKIIASMREPISRTLSMLAHNLDLHSKGCLAKGDAYPCLKKELVQSNYSDPFEAWMEAYPPSQVLLLQYERLTSEQHGKAVLRKVKGFLGIDPELPSEAATIGRNNTRKQHLEKAGALEGGQQPKGWRIKRHEYEDLVSIVRPDAERVASMAEQAGWASANEWMAAWEMAWQATLNTCTRKGRCELRPN